MSTDGKKEVNNLNEAFANMTPDQLMKVQKERKTNSRGI